MSIGQNLMQGMLGERFLKKFSEMLQTHHKLLASQLKSSDGEPKNDLPKEEIFIEQCSEESVLPEKKPNLNPHEKDPKT